MSLFNALTKAIKIMLTVSVMHWLFLSLIFHSFPGFVMHTVSAEDDYDYDDDEYDEEEDDEEDEYESGLPFEERNFKSQSNSFLDLIDENRDIQIKPEDYIYPFDPVHTPMLSRNLVATVQSVSSSFYNTKKVKKGKGGRKLRGRGGITKLGGKVSKFAALRGSTGKGKRGKKGSKATVKVPEFDISGTFGTPSDSYVVIGQRYYTIGDRLKGSRDMRRVVVDGIDDQFAYFTYKKHKFVKKIKALESVF